MVTFFEEEEEEEFEVEPQAAMLRIMGTTARAAANFFTAMSLSDVLHRVRGIERRQADANDDGTITARTGATVEVEGQS